MSNTKLEVGEVFYHKDLNKLILCRDEYFNLAYDRKDQESHLKNKIKYYTVDNSGKFHTTSYKLDNNWDRFVVVKSQYGGGGTGHGPHDIYPDAWEVICSPINDLSIQIKFHQQTNCYAHTIEKVQILI